MDKATFYPGWYIIRLDDECTIIDDNFHSPYQSEDGAIEAAQDEINDDSGKICLVVYLRAVIQRVATVTPVGRPIS